MVLLTNKAKISEILHVAIGYNETEFNVFIREAQDFDLKPLLCEDFYYELVAKREDADWKLLIDGGDYEYESKDFFFRGFADVLAYFTYARFILKCNYVSSSHGFSIKKTPHSEPMSLDEKRNMYYKYKTDANKILEDVSKYIERHIGTYESWESCKNCGVSTRTTGFKTKVIQ